ncbi:MarR family winged helix-turn-helix transcriptional regulator [Mycobacterium sp. NPDC048908]|uniref:MarR family winged helix-turn-helix transcriptional regulator n=1 Tax=Mycobacterium sp. NPDC048908 TaxID=3364292 RepID=UPI003722D1DE
MKTKAELVDQINALIGAVGDKFDAEEGDPERDYVVEHIPKRLAGVVRGLPTLGMHLLAHIAEGPVSVVGLAARAGQLKGTVSKHVQRLVEAGLVERVPIPGNRKEVTLRLTADGKIVADAHEKLHAEMKRGIVDFLSRYSNAELSVLSRVLSDFLAAQKVGVRIVPGAN